MPASTSEGVDQTVWEDIFQLLAVDRWDRSLLANLLDLWCRGCGLSGAALYLPSGEGWRSQARVGDVRLPEVLQEPQEEGFVAFELPHALLLYPAEEGTRARLPDPLTTVLGAVTRIHELKRQLKEHRFQVRYRGVELEALYDVGLAITSTLDLEQVSEEILMRAVSLLDARRGALYLVKQGSYCLNRTFGGEASAVIDARDPALEVLLRGEQPPSVEFLPGARHILAVPIEIDRKPRGLLVVADKESRHGVGPFPVSDRRTLALFANQAGIALENASLHLQALEKERLEREMELAAEIQSQILPKELPQVPGFEVLGWSRPARQVGGDYYDLLNLPDGRLMVAVGDVSGKGMPAALMVSTLHSALRLLLDRFEAGPDFIDRLNGHILESSAPNKFITFLLAELEPGTGRVTSLNAGHNPALILRQNLRLEELPAGGLPLGFFRDRSYQAKTAVLEPGDLLCLYSDGITESTSRQEEEFGCQRLVELLRQECRRPLADIARAVARAVEEFSGGQPQADDQTLVLLRRNTG